jgi:Uma2 family endonuclease
MIEDPHLQAERRRMGGDRWDEVWEGELHMVPPPSGRHQSLASELFDALRDLARARGLKRTVQPGFYRAADDYRVPDLAFYRPEQLGDRGLEGAAELLVELVSPGDRSRAKLPWYAARDVREVLLVDSRTLAVELYDCAGGEPKRVEPAHSAVLECTFTRLDDDHLQVVTPTGTVVVSP